MSRASQIEQDAARWLIRREEPGWSGSDQAAFESWLDEAMAHKAAYWRLEHGWREADRIGALGRDVLDTPPEAPKPTGWRLTAIAASLIGLFAVGSIRMDDHNPDILAHAKAYQTQVGRQETVPLIDGSKVELNTASAMRTAVSSGRREVWLDRGEAYFEIAHRDGRPFIVHAGSRDVTVLGTKFAVRRDGDRVTVSVVEGRVRIDDAQKPDSVPTAIITAGDIAVARGPSTLLAANSEDQVQSALAWREGMLQFDHSSLRDAATEFNRYNHQQLVIGDVETGDIRIGGTFQASNVEAFARLLHDSYGLQIETSSGNVKISRQ